LRVRACSQIGKEALVGGAGGRVAAGIGVDFAERRALISVVRRRVLACRVMGADSDCFQLVAEAFS
jgi:hypothetical protein